MKIKYFDYHIQALDHGKNKKLKIEETIESAISQGLSAICLTDHYPLPDGFQDLTNDIRVSYPAYAEKVLAAREKFKDQIQIYLGAEFDYMPEYADWTRRQIESYPFDYVIGSVHDVTFNINGKEQYFCVDFSPEEFKNGVETAGGIESYAAVYYQRIQNLIKSGLFDGLGHLDRIKVFNSGNYFNQKEDWYRKYILETLDILAMSEMVMEINTSGWDKECREQYPSTWILKEAYKREIQLTVGSDGHVPEKIGKNIKRAVELSRTAGYKKLIRFKKRKKIEVQI